LHPAVALIRSGKNSTSARSETGAAPLIDTIFQLVPVSGLAGLPVAAQAASKGSAARSDFLIITD
jgi:hypothetical protein